MNAIACRRGNYDKPNLPIGPVLEYYGATIHYRRGGWQKILCPFHGETRPSATVNFDINRFQCHVGCTDRAEDTVGLIQHIDGLDFLAALRKAEEITGQSSGGVQRKRGPSRSLLDGAWTDD